MANISEYLKKILSARYGKDVRQSIHDAIHQCYEDGKVGSVDLIAREQIETVEAIAKGRNQSVSYPDYETMIAELNIMTSDSFIQGQGIYIGTVDVPDLWVYSVEEAAAQYEYSSDSAIIDEMTENITIQVGYFKLAMLETQKVDLTEYAKQGDVDAINSNLETVSIHAEDSVVFRKSGNTVFVTSHYSNTIPSKTWTTIATLLDSKYFPIGKLTFPITTQKGTEFVLGNGVLSTDGILKVFFMEEVSSGVYFAISYPINSF